MVNTFKVFEPGLLYEAAFDCFESMAAGADSWNQRYRQPVKGCFKGKTAIVHTEHLQLAITLFAPGIHVLGQVTGGCYTFGFSLGKTDSVYCQARSIEENMVFVGRLGQEMDFRAYHDCELLVLCVSDTLLRRFFIERGITIDPASLPDHLVIDSSRKRNQIAITWTYWHKAARRNPDMLKRPEVARDFEYSVLEALAEVLPSDMQSEYKHVRRVHVARQAEAMLREQETRQLRIAEICSCLGVSERTLRQGFHECFGVSPKRYQRLLKLNTVYRELRIKNGPGVSVSDVAYNLGFTGLGRMSVDYRELFGESPSQTMYGKERSIPSSDQ